MKHRTFLKMAGMSGFSIAAGCDSRPAISLSDAGSVESTLQKKALFVVSFSNFMVETTSMADLILPVSLPLETWDEYGGWSSLVATLQRRWEIFTVGHTSVMSCWMLHGDRTNLLTTTRPTSGPCSSARRKSGEKRIGSRPFKEEGSLMSRPKQTCSALKKFRIELKSFSPQPLYETSQDMCSWPPLPSAFLTEGTQTDPGFVKSPPP